MCVVRRVPLEQDGVERAVRDCGTSPSKERCDLIQDSDRNRETW